MTVPDKPRFRGSVTYPPAPAGFSAAVSNARIQIWDVDEVGNDLLVDARTDVAGRFDVTSTKMWQDTKSFRIGVGPLSRTVTGPDLSDMPVFLIQIDDPAFGRSVRVPFPYLGDNIEVPLVVPWGPPLVAPPLVNIPVVPQVGIPVLRVNGLIIKTNDPPAKVWETIKDLVESKQRVTLQFYGPIAAPLAIAFRPDGSVDYPALRAQVCALLGIDPNSSVLNVNPEVTTLIAICVIVFIICVCMPAAIGGSVFMICCALAILLAVALGYRVEVKRKDTASGGTRNSAPIPLFETEIILIPPA